MTSGNPQTMTKDGIAIAAATYTGTASATIIDCLGFREAKIKAVIGTVTSTASMTLAIEMGSASNGSDKAAVTGATMTAFSASNHQKIVRGRLHLLTKPRYLSISGAYAGSGNVPMTVVVELMHAEDSALANQTYAFSV